MDQIFFPLIAALAGGYLLVRNIIYFRNEEKLREYLSKSLKAKLWVNKLGIEKTIKLAKNIFLPIGTLISCGLLAVGILGLSNILHLNNSNYFKIEKISQIYLDGDSDKALKELNLYLHDYPKDDLAWTIKGNILSANGVLSEAEQAYTNALYLNNENFNAANGMGILYRKHGEYDKALSYYKKALEIEPNDAQAYTNMAIIEIKRNNDSEALKLAIASYEKDKKDPNIAANLAVMYHYNNLEEERDKFAKIAKDLGYQEIATLQKIFSGELTLREE